jgi:hypothetical protein
MNPATRDDLIKEFAAGVVYELLDSGPEFLDVSEFVDEHYDTSEDETLKSEVLEEVREILNHLEDRLDNYYND